MPGIAGIISKSNNRLFEKDIYSMLRCMMHESFYKFDIYINKNAGIYVGSINHIGSFSDCMPVFNEKKDLCLFFSGENYYDMDIIEQLKSRGHEFDTSNASYLIHLYEENNDDFIYNLNGQFNGVLFDIHKGIIVVFNDRYGMRRIYFYQDKDAFYFSSEAKSLLNIMPNLRNVDYQSLGEIISCGCTLENRSLFSKINIIPPGSKWTFRNGCNIKKEHYFDSNSYENKQSLDIEEYLKYLSITFSHILPRYFYAKEPIGMSLTGGLDTRMIIAYLNLKSVQLPCYTFGGMYKDNADVKIAQKVAKVMQLPYDVIRVGKDFISDFQNLAEKTVYITDGNLDVSGAPELYVNRLARKIAPIRITGNYGSEVLRGNVAFKPNPPAEKIFDKDLNSHIQYASKTYSEIKREHPLSFILFKQVPWHHYGRFAIEQSQLTVRSPFLDNDLVNLVYQAPKNSINPEAISQYLIKKRDSKLFEIKTDKGIGGNSNHLSSLISKIFQKFTFKTEYLFDYGMPQSVAKINNILKHFHFENLFLGRHKFYHFRYWYANDLSNYVREILLDERTLNRPYVNKSHIMKIVSGHIKGSSNYTIEIHKLLSIELIHRLFIDH